MLITESEYKKHLNGFFIDIAGLYPSLFRFFESPVLPESKNTGNHAREAMRKEEEDEEIGNAEGLFSVDDVDGKYDVGASAIEERLLPGRMDAASDPLLLSRGVAFRLLAYLLIFLGVCRLISAFYWGCGYVYMGVASCIAEISIVSTELLHHRSVRLHRAMSVLLELGVLSEIYLGTAIPYCHV